MDTIPALVDRIAQLERQQRRPGHYADFTDRQRQAITAIANATGCPWRELSAPGRGPARTANARRVLYEVLAQWCDMTDGQIGRMLGRSRQAVFLSRQRLACCPEDFCDCPIHPLAQQASNIADALYEQRYDESS